MLVTTAVTMLAAICLDDQAMLETGKIGDIAVLEIDLMPPFAAAKPLCAQQRPQPRFGFGRLPTHSFGSVGNQRMAGMKLVVGRIRTNPSPSHAFGAGPSLSRKGRGVIR